MAPLAPGRARRAWLQETWITICVLRAVLLALEGECPMASRFGISTLRGIGLIDEQQNPKAHYWVSVRPDLLWN